MSLKNTSHIALNLLGLGFSAYASYEAFKLSASHLGSVDLICPVLLGIPACVIVLICYLLIALAWAMVLAGKQNHKALIVFSIGFTPAFLLALIGSAGEIFNFASCPHTPTGFPKCFISFWFLIALAIAWAVQGVLLRRNALST